MRARDAAHRIRLLDTDCYFNENDVAACAAADAVTVQPFSSSIHILLWINHFQFIRIEFQFAPAVENF